MKRNTWKIRKSHVIFGAPLLATFILLVGAAFWHIPTEVEISLRVSGLEFVYGGQSQDSLFNPVKSASLTIQNFEVIDLGNGILQRETSPESHTPQTKQRLCSDCAIRIRAAKPLARITLKEISLNRLNVPTGATIALSFREHELKLQARAHCMLRIGQRLRFICHACMLDGQPHPDEIDSTMLQFSSAREHLVAVSGNDDMVFTFELPLTVDPVKREIPVAKNLSFMEDSTERFLSTIKSGTIRYKALNDKKRKIIEGGFITIGDLRNFRIKKLVIDSAGIDIILHGTVGKLKTGSGLPLPNRLPTVLEYVRARENWVFIVNAVFLVFTTLLSRVERKKESKEEGKG